MIFCELFTHNPVLINLPAGQVLFREGEEGHLMYVLSISLLAAAEASRPARYNPYLRAIGWDDLAGQLRPFVLEYPHAVLLADNRTLLAHMAYELRDLQPQVVSWNPQGVAGDHFKLTTNLRAHLGGDALFIGEQAPVAAVSGRFADFRKLASLQVRLDASTSRQLEVYLLHEFQGY